MSDWLRHAACKGMPANTFYPASSGNGVYERARHICGQCPVQLECLKHANQTGERHGVWGGLAPDERRPAIRQVECAGCGQPIALDPSANSNARYCKRSCQQRDWERRRAS